MKIRHVRFENLNSLAGSWAIDLTDPAYSTDGIFAITGPTGSGKTTILDAICLALYGCTPRLPVLSQSTCEIMSRRTGWCSAEVEFESAHGSFRCHWSQHRANKKSSGKLQAPKHEIVDAESGEVLETKRKAVLAKVETVTGLDFHRFTRSILLAQGGFAAFLDAKPDERSPILEQITGTELYSRISQMTHELTVQQRSRYREMQGALDDLELPSTDDMKSLDDSCGKARAEIVKLQENEISLQSALEWCDRVKQVSDELVELDLQRNAIDAEKQAKQEAFARWGAAKRARDIRAEYVQIETLAKQQGREEAQLRQNRNEHVVVMQKLELTEQKYIEAKANLARWRDRAESSSEVIKQVREIDTRLRQANESIDEVNTRNESNVAQQQRVQESITSSTHQRDTLLTQQADIQRSLDENRNDALLVESLEAVRQRLQHYIEDCQQWQSIRNDADDQVRTRVSLLEEIQQGELRLNDLRNDLNVSQTEHDSLRQCKVDLLEERLADWWQARILELHEQRRGLDDLVEKHQRHVAIEAELSQLQSRLAGLEREAENAENRRQSLERELGTQSKLVEVLDAKHRLLARVEDLERFRVDLVEGEPCPLCGATGHPYAMGHTPEPDSTAEELAQAREQMIRLNDQLAQCRESIAIARRDKQYLDEQVDALQKEQEGLEDLIATSLTSLDCDITECMDDGVLMFTAVMHEFLDRQCVQIDSQLESCRNTIAQATALQQKIDACRVRLDEIRESVTEAGQQLETARVRIESIDQSLERLGHDTESLRDKISNAGLLLADQLASYLDVELLACFMFDHDNLTDMETLASQVEDIESQLQHKRSHYQKTINHRDQLADEIRRLEKVIEQDRVRLDAIMEAHDDIQERRDALTVAIKDLSEKRHALYGDRDPGLEEQQLKHEIHAADEQLQFTRTEQTSLSEQKVSNERAIAELESSLAERRHQIQRLQETFDASLHQAGFTEEKEFIAALPDDDAYRELDDACQALLRREQDLDARLVDRRELFAQLKEKPATDRKPDELRDALTSIRQQNSEQQAALGAMEERLRRFDELHQRHAEQLDRIRNQQVELQRWERMHDLIGSSDGKKFRNFAQGLTFQSMVAYANRHLHGMNDRYLLVRDENDPLELNVIDNYQAGQTRSTKNLSGGESFIISLALALGLSSMASRNVQVDSLFLDEGFGTLDEQSLQMALDTLSGLHQSGKIIGVISHVQALKERIATQIRIDKQPGGISRLSGPGCRKVGA